MGGIFQSKRRPRVVAIGAAFLVATACAIGFWSARSRAITDPFSRGTDAYTRGQVGDRGRVRPADPRGSKGRSGGAAAPGPGIGTARSRRRLHGNLSAAAR